ncbi:hypothetical protein AWRI1631_154800 [Saccharomyces cerevisiae AWRI1631]|uniref:Uncharacterized protein n=1 Tax=Saccharomyces cerevisiae (strain AWRI1631) TaxID=545124 RepID=B5VSK9_YEAS6|nr:hypothetical protein AWRI1631_154800 [Saccharomyces cerevisiae AWRI1631]
MSVFFPHNPWSFSDFFDNSISLSLCSTSSLPPQLPNTCLCKDSPKYCIPTGLILGASAVFFFVENHRAQNCTRSGRRRTIRSMHSDLTINFVILVPRCSTTTYNPHLDLFFRTVLS